MRVFWLWLHISIAIIAFGPTFTFPVWTLLARRAGPPVTPWVVNVVRLLFERVIIPLAVAMPFTGVALIFVSDWDLAANEWLTTSIVLYTIAFGIAVGLGLPNVRRILSLMASGPDEAGMAEIRRRADRQLLYGYANNALILMIVALMVWKPGAG